MRVAKKTALEVLNTGLSTGADYAEIYYQDNRVHSYVRRYHKPYSVSSGQSCGVGIRLLKGTKYIYGYTSDLSKKSLIELAKSLAFGFEGSPIKHVDDLKERKHKNINKIEIPHEAWSSEEKLSYLEKGESAAYAISDKIKQVACAISEEDEYVEIYNSEGLYQKDTRVRTRLSGTVVASDGTQFQSASEGPGLSKGLELLRDIDFVAMMEKSARLALDLLEAENGPSGELPVVLGNHFGGVLFHEACGHPLEGSAIYHKTSPFSGKLGQKIASDVVTAIDDGTIENGWGSENIDDEGNIPTKNVLIKDGVLVNYMVDRFTSRSIDGNLLPTGSARRESYRYAPTTRMTNTYIDNGKSDPEDIIASVKRGIYCKGFTGGQVDPATDKFVFTSDVAYLIKDGKIDKMIKPVSLTGYGYEILKAITMVGNDLSRAPGVCGAASGSIYVEVGQPTLLISKILVGGQGGK